MRPLPCSNWSLCYPLLQKRLVEYVDQILAKKMGGQIDSRPESDNKPARRMTSKTGVGEREDRVFRLSEKARLDSVESVRPTAMSPSGDTGAFDWGRGPGAEGWSTILCVVKAVTGLSEVVGMRRLSVVVWPMGCKEPWIVIWLSRNSASVSASLTGSGPRMDEEGGPGLETERTKVRIWSCEIACAMVVETSSLWM